MERKSLKIGGLYKASDICKKKYSKKNFIFWQTSQTDNGKVQVHENDILTCIEIHEKYYLLLSNMKIIRVEKNYEHHLEQVL